MEDLLDVFCSNCYHQFKKKERNFFFTNKLPHRTFNISEALKVFFGDRLCDIDEKNYLCGECSNKLGSAVENMKKFNEKREGKNESYISKSIALKPTVPIVIVPPSPKSPSNRKRKRVIVNKTPVKKKIEKYLAHSRERSIMQNHMQLVIRKEMTKLINCTCLKKRVTDHKQLTPSDFDLQKEFSGNCPLLYSLLSAAMIRKVDLKKEKFLPQMRSILSIMLNTKNRSVSVFQKAGLELFYGKSSMRTFGVLNKLGICCSYNTVTRTLDELVKGFDTELLNNKQELSNKLHAAQQSDWIDEPEAREDKEKRTDPKPGFSRKIDFDEEQNLTKPGMYAGGIFTVDNINHLPQTLHHSSKGKPAMINMTSVEYLYNRVHQRIEDVIKPKAVSKAVDVDMSAYIPSFEDMKLVKEDHKTLLKRILVKHIPYFRGIQNHDSIVWYKPHLYTDESKQKSRTINLGMIDADGATTEGTKQVITFVKQYFPVLHEDKQLPTVVGGDALTCDLIRSTMFHMCNSDTEDEKLNGPNPAVGQFHLRMCLLLGILKQFMGQKGKSKPGAGTLPNLRALFGHPEKMDDVKKHFHLATRFMDFALASYVCGLAMKLLGMSSNDYDKVCLEISKGVKVRKLEKAVKEIMDFQWLDIARNTSQERFCVCQEVYEKEDKRQYIACVNNRCKHQFWYHVDCLNGIDNKTYRKPPKRITSKYFCTKQCEDEACDKVVLYSQGFINAWLNFSAYRDAIRCNDGERMNVYNKLHLINFSVNNNPKYFRVLHLWQAQKAGWAAPNITFDMYNSTVNFQGKANSNFELDLFHEFLNRYLKSLILVQFGLMSKARLVVRSRTHQILKEVSNNWELLLREVDGDESEHNARYEKWKDDIKSAAEILLKNKVFTNCGKREHNGFPDFIYKNCFVENISLYREKINTLAQRLDHVQQYSNEVRHSTLERRVDKDM